MTDFFERIKGIAFWSGWAFALYMVLFSIVVLWLALVLWTLKDARKRLDDKLLVALSVAVSVFFPYMGTLVYAILRPSESLVDVRERELEIKAMEQELGGSRVCPSCGEPIGDDFLVCPRCRKSIRSACLGCGRPLEVSWRVCPYCAFEVTPRRDSASLEEVTELVSRQG